MDFKELSTQYGIAITGGIACGKSTIARIIAAQNYLVIDADDVARKVVAPSSPGLKEIEARFGLDVVNEDGALNRAALRKIIVSDTHARKDLEAITHPKIHLETENILRKSGLFEKPRFWFYEAALIYEIGRQNQFSQVWVAYCQEEVQVKRIMTRDQCSLDDAKKIIGAQMPVMEKVKKSTLAINTDITKDELGITVKNHLNNLPKDKS